MLGETPVAFSPADPDFGSLVLASVPVFGLQIAEDVGLGQWVHHYHLAGLTAVAVAVFEGIAFPVPV